MLTPKIDRAFQNIQVKIADMDKRRDDVDNELHKLWADQVKETKHFRAAVMAADDVEIDRRKKNLHQLDLREKELQEQRDILNDANLRKDMIRPLVAELESAVRQHSRDLSTRYVALRGAAIETAQAYNEAAKEVNNAMFDIDDFKRWVDTTSNTEQLLGLPVRFRAEESIMYWDEIINNYVQ